MNNEAHPRRPRASGPAFFDSLQGGRHASAAGELLAEALVRREGERDSALIQRIVHLAETEGLDALAELWAEAPAVSLPGALWRLYLLRESVRADPVGTAQAYERGHASAPVDTAIAGVVEPYGPSQMLTLLDTLLQGISVSEFADVLFRASAFARIVATGRAHLAHDHEEALATSRFLTLAQDLEKAAKDELYGTL